MPKVCIYCAAKLPPDGICNCQESQPKIQNTQQNPTTVASSTRVNTLPKVCIYCGVKLPESGICGCTMPQQTQYSSNTFQEEEDAPWVSSETVSVKVEQTLQQTTSFLGGIFRFLTLFLKRPVITMQKYNLKMSEAMFFAVLQPLSLFLLLLVIASRIKEGATSIFGYFGGYIFDIFLNDNIGMFFKTFIFSTGALTSLLVISIILGKLIYQGKLDIKKLFALTVISQIPLTVSLILSTILIYFSVQLVLLSLIFGLISSIAVSTFVFAPSFNISFDRCVYCSIFTYSAQTIVLYILVTNIVGL